MITDTLTLAQRNQILAGPGNGIAQVVFEKLGFEWSQCEEIPTVVPTQIAGMGNYVALGAIVGGVVKIWLWYYGQTPSTLSCGTNVVLFSIAQDGTVMFVNSSNQLFTYTFGGASNMLATLTFTPTAMAATGGNRCHFTYTYGTGITRLVTYDGGEIYSDVYWPYTLTNFTASRNQNEVSDSVILCGQGVPYQTIKAQGIKAAWELRETTAAVSLLYRRGQYSDHYTIAQGEPYINQQVSQATAFWCPKGAGVIWVQAAYGNSMVLTSTSPTGRMWEIPCPLSFPVPTSGKPLFAVGNTFMYYYADGELWISPGSYLYGVHDPHRQFVVTDPVLQGKLSVVAKAGLKGLTLECTPAMDAYLADEQPLMVALSLGYEYASVRLLTPIFLGEVDDLTRTETPDGHVVVTVNATDVLAWLDRVSGYAMELPMRKDGFDVFTDTSKTETDYGGMRHVFAVQESWQTPEVKTDDWQLCPTDYADGKVVAFSTFVPDALNGLVQSKVKWNGSGEYVGLVGRGVASYIFWEALLNTATGALELALYDGTRQSDGKTYVRQVLATGTISTQNPMWLRYMYRYAQHQVGVSTDGVNFTTALTAYTKLGAWPGHMGVTGYVVGDPEVPWTPPDNPDDPWVPPEYPDEPWEPPQPDLPPVAGVAAFMLQVTDPDTGEYLGSRVFITTDFDSVRPTWMEVVMPEELIMLAHGRGLTFGIKRGTNMGLYALAKDNLYYSSDATRFALAVIPKPSGKDYGGQLYGGYDGPLIQHSPDQSAATDVLVSLKDSEVTDYYAWVLRNGTQNSLTKVGSQSLQPTRHVSWYDESNFFAGHSNSMQYPACCVNVFECRYPSKHFWPSKSGVPGYPQINWTWPTNGVIDIGCYFDPPVGGLSFEVAAACKYTIANSAASCSPYPRNYTDLCPATRTKGYLIRIDYDVRAWGRPDDVVRNISSRLTGVSYDSDGKVYWPGLWHNGAWHLSAEYLYDYVDAHTKGSYAETEVNTADDGPLYVLAAGCYNVEVGFRASQRNGGRKSYITRLSIWAKATVIHEFDAVGNYPSYGTDPQAPYGISDPRIYDDQYRLAHNTVPIGHTGDLIELAAQNCNGVYCADLSCGIEVPQTILHGINGAPIIVVPGWATMPLEKLRRQDEGGGWIGAHPVEANRTYMTTGDVIPEGGTEGSVCYMPGAYDWDIPIDHYNGARNIAQRDGLAAALNSDRTKLYISDDGFKTLLDGPAESDHVAVPQDLIGPIYPGVDIFYVGNVPCVAVYGQNGAMMYHTGTHTWTNKSGNLVPYGTTPEEDEIELPSNAVTLYNENGTMRIVLPNGISVRDMDAE